jgi:hypothetical protein
MSGSLNRQEIDTPQSVAWDMGGEPEIGPSFQPWRAHWPVSPNTIQQLCAAELQAQPWLTWKRDPQKINDKPWYQWVNRFEGDIGQPCDGNCPYCGGKGCVRFPMSSVYNVPTNIFKGVCSTVAEGG